MVLGLRSKNKKGASFNVSYDVHIQEIKPWPPSQSQKSLRSVVLQWENGDRSSGATSPAVPSLGSGAAEEGRIEFSESFKLDVTLSKDGSNKEDDKGPFQKNILQFNLYETRKDKSKGQHLGGAAIDLAEHGIIREAVAIDVPVQTKRGFRNAAQPVLYFRIQPSDTGAASSPPSKEVESKEVPADSNGKESKSTLPNEGRPEDVEIASFTDDDDDDAHLHSSLDNSPSAPAANVDFSGRSSPSVQEEQKNVSDTPKDVEAASNGEMPLAIEEDSKADTRMFGVNDATINQNGSLPASGLRTNADSLSSENLSENGDTFHKAEIMPGNAEDTSTEQIANKMIEDISSPEEPVQKNVVGTTDVNVSSDTEIQKEISENLKLQQNTSRGTTPRGSRDQLENVVTSPEIIMSETEKTHRARENDTHGQFVADGHKNFSTASAANADIARSIPKNDLGESTYGRPDLSVFSKNSSGDKGTKTRRRNSVNFSVRSSPHSKGSIVNGSSDQYAEDVKEIDTQEDAHDCGTNSGTDAGTDDMESTSSSSGMIEQASRADRSSSSGNKVRELEARVKALEGELREVAAVEIGLYSIAAEHGSSAHKVHTPARRLARLYRHASKQWTSERRASAARTIVSTLALVAKACGNDVPRLTFWLSNAVVLRTIVSQTVRSPENVKNAGYWSGNNGLGKFQKSKSSPLKWASTSLKNKNSFSEGLDDFDDPETFALALEKIESWIFHRVVESVWWQTFTPCMHYWSGRCDDNQEMHSKKNYERAVSASQKRDDNSSIEIWKKAFEDASEKLCPVRGGGHECGCLRMLSRLVMEQCVARLDVAMFNAILREPDDVIPTDPISDPISDPKVLPVESAQLSFGTGAQLKGSIGTWSRWLSDLFGMDVDESGDEVDRTDDNLVTAAVPPPKSFHLLNSLSDLLMLPKDMLLDKSMRKEVCPAFSSSMIKQILNRFVADEFSPDQIPANVFEALDFEESEMNSTDEIRSAPCSVSPVTYCAPSAASVQSIIGETPTVFQLSRSGSSLFRKCHTSDDELDDVDSPLASVFTPNAEAKSCGNPSIRYQLLREVWKGDEWS